jgi:hypothetical protein
MHGHSTGFLCKSQNEDRKMLLGKPWASGEIKIQRVGKGWLKIQQNYIWGYTQHERVS